MKQIVQVAVDNQILTSHPPPLPCLINQDGTLTSSLDESIAVLLNSIIPNEAGLPPDRPVLELPDYRCFPYTKEKLHTDLSSISPNKAPGTDMITTKMVKVSLRIIENPLIQLINSALANAHFPSCWKHAQVVCILKSPNKDVHIAKPYRPISLLPVLSKLLEKAINTRLSMATRDQFFNRQFGFTHGKSTEDAVENLLNWN